MCGILKSNYSIACWGKGDRFGTDGSLVYNSTMPDACACKKSCQRNIISGYGALCGTGGAEGDEELDVCQACAMPLNASVIFIANGRASTGLAVALSHSPSSPCHIVQQQQAYGHVLALPLRLPRLMQCTGYSPRPPMVPACY